MPTCGYGILFTPHQGWMDKKEETTDRTDRDYYVYYADPKSRSLTDTIGYSLKNPNPNPNP